MTDTLDAEVAPAPDIPPLQRARALLVEHAEIAALAAIIIATFFFPGSIPAGIYGLGAVAGASLAIQTIGLVLVYRSNRLINFAQVQVGAVGAILFVHLIYRGTFLMGIHAICNSCVKVRTVTLGEDEFTIPARVPGWLWQTNFWLSMIVALGVTVLLSYLAYIAVVRRFENAPRVVATLVTIGLGQTFSLLAGLIPRLYGSEDQLLPIASLPFKMRVTITGVVFDEGDILTAAVCAIALVGIAVFLRRSAVGVVLRGAAENPDRARTLGVNVASVNSLVWLVAGLLSGLAWVLTTTSGGASGATESVLVRLLAAGVIARMTSVPIAVAAAIVLGMLDQSVLWSLKSPNLVDGVLLAVIVGVLLIQRNRAVRSDTEADAGWQATKEVRPIPAELRDLPVVRNWIRNLRGVVVVVLLGLPWVLSPTQTNLAAVTLIYAIIGLSLARPHRLGRPDQPRAVRLRRRRRVRRRPGSGWPFPLSIVAGALVGVGRRRARRAARPATPRPAPGHLDARLRCRHHRRSLLNPTLPRQAPARQSRAAAVARHRPRRPAQLLLLHARVRDPRRARHDGHAAQSDRPRPDRVPRQRGGRAVVRHQPARAPVSAPSPCPGSSPPSPAASSPTRSTG